MRGFGVVFTPSVACKRFAFACKRNILTGIEKKNHCSFQLDACQHSDDFHSIQFLGRLFQFLHRAKRMVDMVVDELTHWDVDLYVGSLGRSDLN